MARIRKYPRTQEDFEAEMTKWTTRRDEHAKAKKEASEELAKWETALKKSDLDLKIEINRLREELEKKREELREAQKEKRSKRNNAEGRMYQAISEIRGAEKIINKLNEIENFVKMQEHLAEHPDQIIAAFKVHHSSTKGYRYRGGITGKTIPNVIGAKINDWHPVARINITPKQLEISIKDGGSGNFSDNTMHTIKWPDVEVIYEEVGDMETMVTFDSAEHNSHKMECCWNSEITPRFACPDADRKNYRNHSTWGSEPCSRCKKHKRANPSHGEIYICKCGKRLRVSAYAQMVGA